MLHLACHGQFRPDNPLFSSLRLADGWLTVRDASAMLMSGKAGDAAFVDVRGIGGLKGETNRKLSQQICKLLKDSLGIASDCVYLNFTDVEAGNWGWNGSTFG